MRLDPDRQLTLTLFLSQMIAIWTDSNDEVVRKHFNPGTLDAASKNDAYLVESIPADNAGPNEVPTLHYTPTDGFWYTYEQQLTSLPISTDAETRLKQAVDNSDFQAVVNMIEQDILRR